MTQKRPIKILLNEDLNHLWPTKRDLIDELSHEFPNVTFQQAYTENEQQLQIVDADATLGIPASNIFTLNKQLKWVHHPMSGFELEPNHPIIHSKVTLTNAPNAHVIPMAEYVFATMLSITHRLGDHFNDQRSKTLDSTKYLSSVKDLNGQNLGIIGYGEVGKAIAKRAYGFGMNIYGLSRSSTSSKSDIATVWPSSQLNQLLKLSDWIVIAAPLTNETRNMINSKNIQIIRKNAHVIVLSRPHIINENALITALCNGQLAGAVFDNLEGKWLEPSSPLWEMKNVIITPHTSSMSWNLEKDRFNIYRHNVNSFICGDQFIRVADKSLGY